eukprot:TRINITY_DN3826_c0_g1_i16.p1 TRINITY_DN3826_c0_g1~~TRINITY_DN3826_c0_g1_i16.p1  ORF type:complete len:844 (-),score=158.13 TRINITY_DN3826_c0_g1_i16:70-2601(-)
MKHACDKDSSVQEPATKRIKMTHNQDYGVASSTTESQMESFNEESPDMFAEYDDFVPDPHSGDAGVSRGLTIQELPRTDISVGSQYPPLQLTSHRPKSPENGATSPLLPSHTVLVDLNSLRENRVPSPYPKERVDKWDASHVRLPWSSSSRYPVTIGNREQLFQRWDVITEALSPLKSLDWTLDSKVLAIKIKDAIMKYNKRYVDEFSWRFVMLIEFLEDLEDDTEKQAFYTRILPGMVELCLQGPKAITGALPLLVADKSASITLSQHQISVLLANAFFCTFPRRNSTNKRDFEYKFYPDINFNRMLSNNSRRAEAQLEKIKTILAYFRRVIESPPTGLVTFTRQTVPESEFIDWSKDTTPIPDNFVRLSSAGVIETEGKGMLQVDFANKKIGGGVLGLGLVQEEIRFTICPELIISRLFTEKLMANEVVFMHGAEQYSRHTGYGDTYRFDGMHTDTVPRDMHMRRNTTILAMDAVSFSRDKEVQYEAKFIERELNKAYIGFRPLNPNLKRINAVATGNWGCGAFGGDPQLKFLIQLLAGIVTDRKVCYFTFGEEGLVTQGWKAYQSFIENELNVSDVYNLIIRFKDRQDPKQTLFEFLEEKISGNESQNGGDTSRYDVDTDEEEEKTADHTKKSANQNMAGNEESKKSANAWSTNAAPECSKQTSLAGDKSEQVKESGEVRVKVEDDVEAVSRMEEGRAQIKREDLDTKIKKEDLDIKIKTEDPDIKIKQEDLNTKVKTEDLDIKIKQEDLDIKIKTEDISKTIKQEDTSTTSNLTNGAKIVGESKNGAKIGSQQNSGDETKQNGGKSGGDTVKNGANPLLADDNNGKKDAQTKITDFFKK